MQRLEDLTDEQRKYAIDLTATLTVEEIAEECGVNPSQVLHDFVASATGQLLYDESSKLWWNGPLYIAEMYRREKGLHSAGTLC